MLKSYQSVTPPPAKFELSTLSRFFSILLCAAIALFCLFASSCSSEDTAEYDIIALTKDNYKSYITVNTWLSDYNLILLDESYTDDEYYYTASVVIHITTSSKSANYVFSNVEISIRIPVSTWETGNDIIVPTATLDFAGNSHCSYTAIQEHCLISVLTPEIFRSNSIISSIKGCVYVPRGE